MQLRISLFAAIGVVSLRFTSAKTIESKEGRELLEIERIVNGRSATEGQFPWAVGLFFNNQYICSASILSPRTVLTAAHCVVFQGETRVAPVDIFYAIANLRKSSESVRILFESIKPHPDYAIDSNGIMLNDIAILTTTDDIPFDDTVKSICIARKDTNRMEYKKAIAMGWGSTNEDQKNPEFPDVLQYAAQIIVPNGICSLSYSGIPVEESKICAEGLFKGICIGDSGGPLVRMSVGKPPVEIGVASYVSGNYPCGSKAAVSTRVSYFFDFIMRNAVDSSRICVV